MMNLCHGAEDSKQLPTSFTHWSSGAAKGYLARPLQSSNGTHSSHELSSLLGTCPTASASSSSPNEHDVKLWEQSPPGHMGIMRSLRRSTPSLPCTSWSTSGYRAQTSDGGECTTDRAVSEVPVFRARRPADHGTWSAQSPRHYRPGRSVTSRANDTPKDNNSAAMVQEPENQVQRCSSVPPIGTKTADDVAAAMAKAKAVAMLQKLFFEEMAKGGKDPSGAAARALVRLTEASATTTDIPKPPCSPSHRPTVPQVPPPPGANGRRRPRPATFLPVQR